MGWVAMALIKGEQSTKWGVALIGGAAEEELSWDLRWISHPWELERTAH